MTPLALVPGAAVALGLLLAVHGWRPTVPLRAVHGGPRSLRPNWLPSRRPPRVGDRGGGWAEWRWAFALQAGLLAWFLTGWPVAGAAAWAAVIGVPLVFGAGRAARTAIDRAEAVEGWARRLSDVLLTGVGLEQAVAATVTTCPDAVRPQVGALAARLGALWPTETALRAFADDLDDASADLVVACLVLGSRRRGPGLARTLVAVADSLAEEVASRRRIEAERAKPRTTARAVTAVIVAVVAAAPLNGEYLRPYGGPGGQLVLGALLLALTGALAVLRHLAATPPAPRLLTSDTGPQLEVYR